MLEQSSCLLQSEIQLRFVFSSSLQQDASSYTGEGAATYCSFPKLCPEPVRCAAIAMAASLARHVSNSIPINSQNQACAETIGTSWSALFYDCWQDSGTTQPLPHVTYGIFNAVPAIRQIRRLFIPGFHGDPPSSWPRFETWLISSRLSLSCVPLLHKDHTDVVLQGEIHL